MYRHYIKRILDLFLVILLFPFWIIILILITPFIYFEDRGTIFYKDERIGKHGKLFQMYKFRTMKMNAPDIRNRDKSTYNGRNDERVTKIGKILRTLSIDETAQIINVIKNEMSFIGPRPDLPDQIQLYEGDEIKKLDVLPGISGYNQAYYRNCLEWKERLKNDIYYVEHLNFMMDMKVFFKTIDSVMFRRGIYTMERSIVSENTTVPSYECKPLIWDTEHFGILSAKIALNRRIEEAEQQQLLEVFKRYTFITIYNKENCPENNIWIGKKSNAFLTDMNVQFRMNITEQQILSESCVIFHNVKEDAAILSIAKSAFQFSRFYHDPYLSSDQVSDIYYEWTKNAFGRSDKYFVLAERQGELAGYLLCSKDSEDNAMVIELIAVDSNYRKQRVGKSLIGKLIAFSNDQGISTLKVGTQADNTPAVQFYMGVGFQYESCHSIYHLWNENPIGEEL